jgi:hypothetical protein
MYGEADLPQIGDAGSLPAFLTGGSEAGQKQGGKNGNNGDDDQQFNKGEGLWCGVSPAEWERSL